MKFDAKNSLPLLGQFQKIVGALPQKKTGKLSQKQQNALSQLSYYANLGFPPAMTYLGVLYENGYYFKRNKIYAVQLYKKAAECKYPEAYYRLGASLIEGVGRVSPSLRYQALHFYAKAYLMGYIKAGIAMGEYIYYHTSDEYYHENFSINILEKIWETHQRIDARIVLAQFYLQKGIRDCLSEYRLKGKAYFKELVKDYKSEKSAIAWVEFIDDNRYKYSRSERQAVIDFIEKSIPTIVNNSQYKSLKRNLLL